MDKRLQKRHKREVARNQAKSRESLPDVRTPEEKLAAKEASRPTGAERQGAPALFATATKGKQGPAMRGSASKADA